MYIYTNPSPFQPLSRMPSGLLMKKFLGEISGLFAFFKWILFNKVEWFRCRWLENPDRVQNPVRVDWERRS